MPSSRGGRGRLSHRDARSCSCSRMVRVTAVFKKPKPKQTTTRKTNAIRAKPKRSAALNLVKICVLTIKIYGNLNYRLPSCPHVSSQLREGKERVSFIPVLLTQCHVRPWRQRTSLGG